MGGIHKVGISSFAYCFACGTRPFTKPEHIMTPFDLMDKAVSIGADVVQFGDNMPLEVYGDAELEKIRVYAEERGLELEVGMRKATPERLSEYIRITSLIGGHVLRLITDKEEFAPSLDELCRIFTEAIPQLEANRVTLGIENHDRFRAGEYAKMAAEINHELVGLTVDTLNSLSHEELIDEVVENMATYCVCMHIKDYVIKRYNGGGGLKITGACLGTGRMDIPKWYNECDLRSDYNFNVILESWMEPCDTLEETLLKEDEWAREGVKYLKNMTKE